MVIVGKHRGIKSSLFTQKQREQIKKGIQVEKEHTDSELIAKEIAKDHVFEISDYYSRLAIMEDPDFWSYIRSSKRDEPEETEYKCPNCGKPLLESEGDIFCDDRKCGFDKIKSEIAWNTLIDKYELQKVK